MRSGDRGGLFSGVHPTSNFGGFDLGRAGVRPRTIGMFGVAPAAIAGLIQPLESVLGLVGAIPAAAGAAGIAFAAFSSIGSKALRKTIDDQSKATEKFKAGTITAEAYGKAMKNALVGLSEEQKKALPLFREWHDLSLATSNVMASKMLPALGDLGRGLKAIKQPIIAAFGKGAGSLGGMMSSVGGFLQTRQGKAGASALASSSANLLSGFSSASVNLFRSFLDIARAARPLVDQLADDMTRVTAKFAAFTGSFRGQQTLREWFLSSEVAAKKFLAVIGNVGMALHNIGGGVGSGFLDWLVQITERFQQWTSVQGNVDKVAGALKRMADTMLVIGQGIGNVVTQFAKLTEFATKTLGPNTMGWLFLGKMAGGGAVLKGLTKGAAAGVGGRVAGGAAGGAASAGLFGGAAAFAPLIAGAAVFAAGVVGLIVLARSFKQGTDGVANAWAVVGANIERAKNSAAGVAAYTKARARNREVGEGVAPARLALFDAKQQLSADKKALKGLGGKDRERMLIQIEVDEASVEAARRALEEVKKEFKETGNEAVESGKKAREYGFVTANAAQSQVSGLERATDAAAKNGAALAKTGPGAALAASKAKQFAAAMADTAAKLAAVDPRAARFASTAARLAREIGRIPTSREVNISLKGEGQIEQGLKRIAGLIAQIQSKTVRIALESITPVGRPAPGKTPPPPKKGSHGMAGIKVDSPMTIVGEQAPMHPEFVIATNPAYRARNQKLMGEAARSMGGEVNFFAQGGILGSGAATPGPSGQTTFPGSTLSTPRPPSLLAGIDAAIAMGMAYAGGSGENEGTAAAARYAALPGRIGGIKKHMADLHNAVKRDSQFLEAQDDLLVELRARKTKEKDAAKKAKLMTRINHIVHDVIPQRKATRTGHNKSIKADQKTIDKLTAELQELVPGEDGFQDLIATLEGQSAAASELGLKDRVARIKEKELQDYAKRIKFLVSFTGAKSTQKNKSLFAAASAALGTRKAEYDSLRESDTSTGGSGSGSDAADNGDKDQALAMLAELAQWARQGQLSDLIGADQLGVAMDFISKTVGSFAKGSPFIAKGGLAQVHYGERIVPAWENKQSMAPSEATLTLQGSDELTRALAKALGGQVDIQLGRESRRRRREGVLG